jgi:hypothetical protein
MYTRRYQRRGGIQTLQIINFKNGSSIHFTMLSPEGSGRVFGVPESLLENPIIYTIEHESIKSREIFYEQKGKK